MNKYFIERLNSKEIDGVSVFLDRCCHGVFAVTIDISIVFTSKSLKAASYYFEGARNLQLN